MILPMLPVTVETSILEVVIFTGFLYWLCPSFMNSIIQRLAKMVEIATSRMFDSFNRFSPNQSSQSNFSISTISNMNRFSREQRCKRAISREADIKNREYHLFDIKENTPEVLLTRSKLKLACQNCTYTSRESLVDKTMEYMALKNMFNLSFTRSNIVSKYFSDVYHNYKLKKFSYGLPKDETVLKDERIVKSIEKMTKEQIEGSKAISDKNSYQELLEMNRKRAVKLLDTMKSALNDYVLRCSNWFFHKMFPLFLNSVLVHPGQITMLKQASKSGLPLIFLPLHRSHLDYLLLTYIVYNNEIKAPLVAAGDNLRLPFFGEVLRGLGAFYIKRRIDPIEGRKDHVYKSILHTYMNHSLRMGNNVEFYIEGGRTRTGKPLMPKYGVFSVLVDSLLDGSIEDALLVPVSMNYDKLVDGNFVQEQLGEPKKMENVLDTIKSLWKSVTGDYGMVKVDFNQPCSLREMIKSFKTSEAIPRSISPNSDNNRKKLSSTMSTSSIYGTEMVSSTSINKNVIENISRHIVYDACQSTSVMATNAVAFLLLTKYRNGVPIEKLATALDELRTDLNYSRKELSFQGCSVDVINYAVDMLGPALVKKDREDNCVKPNISLPNSIELSYYSNTLVPHFALDSIIALSVSYLDNDSRIPFIDSDLLLETVNELCDIFQYEFIFCKPCQVLEQVITSYLDELICRKQIFKVKNETALESKSRRLALQIEENEEDVFYTSIKYEVNRDKNVQETVQFYREIVLPILECYTVTSQSLMRLAGKSLLEGDIVKEVLDDLKTQLINNSVLHSEAVSTDSVKNALKLFVKWGILECHNEGKLRMYHLRDNQTPSSLYERLRKFIPKQQ